MRSGAAPIVDAKREIRTHGSDGFGNSGYVKKCQGNSNITSTEGERKKRRKSAYQGG